MLPIPRWQAPWYKGVLDSETNAVPSTDRSFRRVPPEVYNRRAHPSLKQLHDFEAWLRETMAAELEAGRDDIELTKAIFVRFFQRGLRAELLLAELMEIAATVINRVDYSEAQRAQVLKILRNLNVEEIGIERGATAPDDKHA